MAKLAGPGAVAAERKSGGVLTASIPASNTSILLERVRSIWGFLEPAESVWETALINYDAIDIVPVALCNVGTIEGRSGGLLLWGEGATRSVVKLVSAVDEELLALRKALGHRDERRYPDFLAAQGLADRADDLYEMIRRAVLVRSVRPSGSFDHLRARLELEVEYSLVLASSIGRSVGCPTPVIDGIVAISGVLLGQDPWARGRTLQTFGLAGRSAMQLRHFALTGTSARSPEPQT
jgi:opine dehydrogenase